MEAEYRRYPPLDAHNPNSPPVVHFGGGWLGGEDGDELVPEAIEEDHPAAKRAVVRIGFLPGETPLFGELSSHLPDSHL